MNFEVTIESDSEACLCPECQQPLNSVIVRSFLTTIDPPIMIDSDTIVWIKGLAQYNISPGWTNWVKENYGYLEVACSECGFATREIEFVNNPNGFRFTESLEMHAKL